MKPEEDICISATLVYTPVHAYTNAHIDYYFLAENLLLCCQTIHIKLKFLDNIYNAMKKPIKVIVSPVFPLRNNYL